MPINGTAYTQPDRSSASVAGELHSLVMCAPVHNTLRQVATNSKAGRSTLWRRATPAALASGGVGGMRREQFPELCREPVELPAQVRFDDAELGLDADVTAAERRVVLDTDAVQHRAQAAEPRSQLARVTRV